METDMKAVLISSRSYRSRSRNWFETLWFRATFAMMVGLTLVTAIASESSLEYLAGQLFLLLSVYFSLYILSDKPLINPIQVVVMVFYWWFGIGPVVTSAFYLLVGAPDKVALAQEAGRESLWIVSLGLPLYAIAARKTLHLLNVKKAFARFLMPREYLFRPSTLLIYALAGLSAKLVILVLTILGIRGITFINFLGGTQTNIWWVGVLNSIGDVFTFATVGIIFSLVAPSRMSPLWLKGIGILIILLTLVSAFTSGWKSAFVIIFFYIICARVSLTQRFPWRLGLAVLLGFLFVVEPFVNFVRIQAQIAGAESPADRKEIFRQALTEGTLTAKRDWKEIQVASLFRGIYPLAGELVRSNTLLNGYWRGKTIAWGLQILVPRALFPEKPVANIGNFFARTVGVDIGISTPENYDYNVGVSIPFEFVGNFGLLAGVLSFPLIGLFWALLCGWLLSASRISSHPFSPLLCFVAITMESAFGSFLAVLRGYIIPLIVMSFIWILRKGKL